MNAQLKCRTYVTPLPKCRVSHNGTLTSQEHKLILPHNFMFFGTKDIILYRKTQKIHWSLIRAQEQL